MVLPDLKVPLDPFICSDGIDLLFPSFDFNLIIFPEDFKQRFVFKFPGCESGQVQVWYDGDIVEYGDVVDQPESFHMDAPKAFFLSLISNPKASSHLLI